MKDIRRSVRLLMAPLVGLCACSLFVEADTTRLAGDPGGGGSCEGQDCSDGIDCTNDFCNSNSGECEHEPLDDRCGGARCIPGVGCEEAEDCTRKQDCDDGTGCNEFDCVDDRCEVRPIDDDSDGFARCDGGDCDDANPGVRPDAPEICGDGLDNDCNGSTDGLDPVCDDPCGADQTIEDSGEVEGDVEGGGAANSERCQRGTGPEAMVRLILEHDSDVMLETAGSNFDTVLYVRDGCGGPEIGCSDNRSERREMRDSRLWLQALRAGEYYVFVDSAEGGGHYRLRARRSDPGVYDCDSPLEITGGGTAVGRTEGPSQIDRSCTNGTGPEAVFRFDLDNPGNVSITTVDSGFDVVQYLIYDDCEGGLVDGGCADQTGEGEQWDGWLDTGRYVLVLDGYNAEAGPFVLRFFP